MASDSFVGAGLRPSPYRRTHEALRRLAIRVHGFDEARETVVWRCLCCQTIWRMLDEEIHTFDCPASP